MAASGRKMIRRVLTWLVLITALPVIGIYSINYYVAHSTRNQIFNSLNEIPERKVGLLLGTSKYLIGGRINYFYKYRIDAAVALFKAGKIKYILVSGDNGHKEYNEPETMQADLIAAGIPADRIILDYAGFRTLDSIVRCRDVFGEDNITIISQPFHNQRALFIARQKGIHAIAFNAQDVSGSTGSRVLLREKLARTKMVLDLLFGKQPKFFGPKIRIG